VAIVLDILRHGQALPAGPDGDRARRLSPEGVRCLRSLGGRLAREGWRPDLIFSSPFERAMESARILARSTGPAAAIEPLDALQPDAEPQDVLHALTFRGIAAGHVLIVGHQPLLGRLVGHLSGRERGLTPGTLIRIDCPLGTDPGSGTVVLTVTPEDPGAS
jgi:phosphohistidine phosphatase